MAFYVAGLPGLALAAVLWLTISEPKRGAMAETFTLEPIGPTLGFLASQRTFVILLAGFCLTTYTNYATSAGCKAEHAGAGIRHHAADSRRIRPGRRTAGGRHAQRRAEERFWRPGRAVFAAVGCGHDHGRGLAVHLGGVVDSGRSPAGELIRHLPFVFIIVLIPARALRLAPCGSNDLYVIYITDALAKNRPKTG